MQYASTLSYMVTKNFCIHEIRKIYEVPMKKKTILCVFILSSQFLFSAHKPEKELFPFQPPIEIKLEPQDILLTHPVTTKSPIAQQFFDQGLTLLYAFNHDYAYWSFQKASQIDPKLAMAYWGMALSLGTNINMEITSKRSQVAYEHIQKALELSEGISENEKEYIKALSKRYSNDSGAQPKELAQNYFNAMKELCKKFPDDLDLPVLTAEAGMNLTPWALWSIDGKPEENTVEVVGLLESVLKRNPQHIGANHYYIHAVEASQNPERGLMCAARLRHIAPKLGHILHMPAHIYILTGDYHEAVICNEEAVAADFAYIKKFGLGGIYPIHYQSHNLYFLSRAYSMEGRYGDALRVAKQLNEFYAPNFQMMPDMEYYLSCAMFVMIRFQHWQDVLSIPKPDSEMRVTNVLWHFGRAMAFAELGKKEEALKEQDLFLQEKKSLKPSDKYGYNNADPIMQIANYVLLAKMAEVKNDFDATIENYQKAINVQDTLHYNEPPDWFFSVRESLGGILLQTKRYADAERIFRDDLSKHPRNGRSLFGLLVSLKEQEKENSVWWIEKEFKKAWQYSDMTLSVSNL